MQIENKNYSCIDIIKFLMSFFVVAIHIQPFVAFEQLSFYRFYDSMLRLAVPFFFMVTGFFLTKKMKKLPQDKWASVFFDAAKKNLRLYLIWTLIYFPLAVYGFVFIERKREPVALFLRRKSDTGFLEQEWLVCLDLYLMRQFILDGAHVKY